MSDDRINALENELSQALVYQVTSQFSEAIEDHLHGLTPIERLMGIALLFALKSDEHYNTEGNENLFSSTGLPGDYESFSHSAAYGFYVHPQFPVGKYRADFFVSYRNWNGVSCAGVIECDGHDFHERTKHQAAHDKLRDRYFQSLGLLVLRYTGSEIYKDPLKCATDALTIISDLALKVRA